MEDTPTMFQTIPGCLIEDMSVICPELPGLDPINKYISHSGNLYMTELLTHQIKGLKFAHEVALQGSRRSASSSEWIL